MSKEIKEIEKELARITKGLEGTGNTLRHAIEKLKNATLSVDKLGDELRSITTKEEVEVEEIVEPEVPEDDSKEEKFDDIEAPWSEADGFQEG
jgi:hypothetical protein